MHKLVIFDIDGTLLDTEVAVLKGLQKCLAIHHNIKRLDLCCWHGRR